MKEFVWIGVDLGKNYLRIHAVESENVTRKLRRADVHKLFQEAKSCLGRSRLKIEGAADAPHRSLDRTHAENGRGMTTGEA